LGLFTCDVTGVGGGVVHKWDAYFSYINYYIILHITMLLLILGKVA